jgi:uncharacterized protein
MTLRVLALVAVLLAPAVTSAQEPPPRLTAPVNDFANVIDAATERELERRIRALHAASGDVVVVATVRTIEPFGTIEDYAVRMFENGGQGIGERGRDNGLLVLVALEQRQIRIETGYDVEEFVPDGYAGETIRQVMRPEFQRGAYSRGILLGTTRLIDRIAERRNVTLTERPPVDTTGTGVRVPWGVIVVLLLFMLLGRGGRRRRRRRWGGGPWSGWHSGAGAFGGGAFGGGLGGFGGRRGGFGGGFGGFGGGRSGGGGATGGW